MILRRDRRSDGATTSYAKHGGLVGDGHLTRNDPGYAVVILLARSAKDHERCVRRRVDDEIHDPGICRVVDLAWRGLDRCGWIRRAGGVDSGCREKLAHGASGNAVVREDGVKTG